MEKSKVLQNMKPKSSSKVPVPSAKPKPKPEETKQAKISVFKTPKSPTFSKPTKNVSSHQPLRKNSPDIQEEVKKTRERILNNSEILKQLLSKFNQNKEEINCLKNEKKTMKNSADKLELLRGFVMSEIEYYLAQNREEPEDDCPEYVGES